MAKVTFCIELGYNADKLSEDEIRAMLDDATEFMYNYVEAIWHYDVRRCI